MLKTLWQKKKKNVGEWWKQDVTEVRNELLRTGGLPAASDAFTINGQPGDLYPCSSSGIDAINT